GEIDFIGGTQGEQGATRFASREMQVQFDPRTRQVLSIGSRGDVSISDGNQIVTGGRFDYDAATGNAEMQERPVMWRGDSQLRADRLIYNENDGMLRMLGHVEAVTSAPDKRSASPGLLGDDERGKPADERIKVTAGNGSYDDVRDTLDFQDDVNMSWGIWNIRSDSVRMEMDPVTGDLRMADALGGVTIHHEKFDATGHSLTYNPENSILILRGTKEQKCLVKQGERGSQGDEIRFLVDENRFSISNGMSMIMPGEMTGSLR
ncbi:hypothetical protein JXA80_13785, partial [bacterium]|nr:hypothetical protein [candidate division CSSED10-310 bacterium]